MPGLKLFISKSLNFGHVPVTAKHSSRNGKPIMVSTGGLSTNRLKIPIWQINSNIFFTKEHWKRHLPMPRNMAKAKGWMFVDTYLRTPFLTIRCGISLVPKQAWLHYHVSTDTLYRLGPELRANQIISMELRKNVPLKRHFWNMVVCDR